MSNSYTPPPLKLFLASANPKLERFFDNDPHSDIKIHFDSLKTYKVQIAFLRIQSGFFSQIPKGTPQIKIQQPSFRLDYFQKVLSCFFGKKHEVPATQICSYYIIARFLKIQTLLKLIRDYVINNFTLLAKEPSLYFELIVLSHEPETTDQVIFDRCMQYITDKKFVPLKEQEAYFAKLPTELLKYLVKTHNRVKAKSQTDVTFTEIESLIKKHCIEKGYGDAECMKLKMELIDSQQLNSEEYERIFHKDIISNNSKLQNNTSGYYHPPLSSKSHAEFHTNLGEHSPYQTLGKTFSAGNPTSVHEIVNSQNVFMKKRIAEMKRENEWLSQELSEIRTQLSSSSKLQKDFEQLLGSVAKREENDSKILASLVERLTALEVESATKDKKILQQQNSIDELRRELEDIKANGVEIIPQQDQSKNMKDLIVQSRILPGNFLKNVYTPSEKQQIPVRLKRQKPEQESLDKSSLEEDSLDNRIQFDERPTTVPRSLLPRLVEILNIGDFQKIRLQLLYRASSNKPGRNEFFKKICQHEGGIILLVKIANSDKCIGGYFSVQITDEEESMYLSDPEAYLFSLSQNRKFVCRNGEQALYICEQYLISFGSDLMINQDCLGGESECNWPCTYQGDRPSSQHTKGASWLVGESRFRIAELQAYGVQAGEMEMKL